MSIVIETTLGDITVDLYLEQRPVTCLNFLKLCKMKYYNFNLFHSIRSGFIAQTGDPTGEGSGGQSIFGLLEGPSKRFFMGEKLPKIRHTNTGTLSMVCTGDMMVGSQFFFTLAPDLDSLDGTHCVIGEVTEGHDVLRKLNDVICDERHRPYRDVRITHTVVLEDPFNDPSGYRVPSRSPSPNAERLKGGRIAPDEEIDETQGKTAEEIQELIEEKEAKARATILEIVGDLPDADIAPPENVLFVCKLNPVTTDEDLEIIFSRFGKIIGCEVIRDKKTGDSLQYAFIEFSNKKACENAYLRMDNVLIDDRRIHVDFSQSVSRMRWFGKGRGVKYFNNNEKNEKFNNHTSSDKDSRQMSDHKNGKVDESKSRHKSKDRDNRGSDRVSRHRTSDKDRSRRSRSKDRSRSEKSRHTSKKDRSRSRSKGRSRRRRSRSDGKSKRHRSKSRDRSKRERHRSTSRHRSERKRSRSTHRSRTHTSRSKRDPSREKSRNTRDRSKSSTRKEKSDTTRRNNNAMKIDLRDEIFPASKKNRGRSISTESHNNKFRQSETRDKVRKSKSKSASPKKEREKSSSIPKEEPVLPKRKSRWRPVSNPIDISKEDIAQRLASKTNDIGIEEASKRILSEVIDTNKCDEQTVTHETNSVDVSTSGPDTTNFVSNELYTSKEEPVIKPKPNEEQPARLPSYQDNKHDRLPVLEKDLHKENATRLPFLEKDIVIEENTTNHTEDSVTMDMPKEDVEESENKNELTDQKDLKEQKQDTENNTSSKKQAVKRSVDKDTRTPTPVTKKVSKTKVIVKKKDKLKKGAKGGASKKKRKSSTSDSSSDSSSSSESSSSSDDNKKKKSVKRRKKKVSTSSSSTSSSDSSSTSSTDSSSSSSSSDSEPVKKKRKKNASKVTKTKKSKKKL